MARKRKDPIDPTVKVLVTMKRREREMIDVKAQRLLVDRSRFIRAACVAYPVVTTPLSPNRAMISMSSQTPWPECAPIEIGAAVIVRATDLMYGVVHARLVIPVTCETWMIEQIAVDGVVTFSGPKLARELNNTPISSIHSQISIHVQNTSGKPGHFHAGILGESDGTGLSRFTEPPQRKGG